MNDRLTPWENSRIPLRPMIMSEQIAERIMAAILRGDYEPGDPIREQELATMFDVSRGPVREALRILEKSGVVSVVAQRGAHVTQLTVREVNNLFEIRSTLAPLLARHLVPADPEVIRILKAETAEMERLGRGKEGWVEFAQISYRLGRMLFRVSDNRQLGDVMESLSAQTARYTRLGLQERAARQFSAKGWRRFVSALEQGDTKAVGEALVELMEALHENVLHILSKSQ